MTDLRSRPAGYEVARACLKVQSRVGPQTSIQRLFGLRPVHPDAAAWFSGTIGEMRVGRVLSRLGPEWTVVHAVPIGAAGSDIDHILVGPAGVFTLNTKRHLRQKVWVGDRRVLVAGQKTDHLRNARYEAERVEKILTRALGFAVPVWPLLVIVESAGVTTRSKPKDVSVLVESELLRWLKRRKPTLDPGTVDRIARLTSALRTWHATVSPDVDPATMPGFAALSAQDESARWRRIGWMALASLLVLVFVAPPLVAALTGALTGVLLP